MPDLPHRPRHRLPHALVELAQVVPGLDFQGEPPEGVVLTGITHDSRAVEPGDLYAALPGARTHGSRYVDEAVALGARAVLTDPLGAERATVVPVAVTEEPRAVLGRVAAWVYDEPSQHLEVYGITGTNGKTTTAYLVEAGLRAAGRRTGLIGTVETRVGDSVLPSVRTTPEAPDLQAVLAVMREEAVTSVAMEVSSHALTLGRVDGTRFAVGLFTNLTQDHLDFHATLEEYFLAKASLFREGRAEVAVINLDDPWGERLVERTRLPLVTYSAAGRGVADWRAVEVVADVHGSTFRVLGPSGEDAPAVVSMPGSFNVSNALAAIAALVSRGVRLEDALSGIRDLTGVPGRLERVEEGQPFVAVVDYAHTPDAVERVLDALRPLTSGRLIVVLGCGGDRDHSKRAPMGAAAVKGADVAIFTNDNPRSEDPLDILSEMIAGAERVDDAPAPVVEPDRALAIGIAVAMAEPGDVVLVAGKGHETGQEQSGEVTAFDDRQVLRAALRDLA